MNPALQRAYATITSTLVSLFLLSFIYGTVSLWGLTVVGANTWKICAVSLLVLMIPELCGRFFNWRTVQLELRFWPYITGIILLLLSDYPERSYGFFAEPYTQSLLLIIVALSFGGTFLYSGLNRLRPEIILTVCIALTGISFLHETAGRLIFSDDHPSFFYRLSQLKDQFPSIPFYSPAWNAGYPAREFFATGILNIFLLSFPLIKFGFLDRPENYTLLVGFISIALVPASLYLAMRLLRFEPRVAAIAGILGLAPSLDLFEWLLQYGTMGFVCSASLLPLVFALTYRMLFGNERLGFRGLTLLLVCSSLCFFWSLAVAAFLPLALGAVVFLRQLLKEQRLKASLLFVSLFLTLNGPWLLTFVKVSKVASFATSSALPGAHSANTKKHAGTITFSALHKKLRTLQSKICPLIVMFSIPGLALLRQRRLALALAATALWLIALSVFGDSFKPQFELRRMNIFATLILLPAAAYGISELWRIALELRSKGLRELSQAGLIATLALVPLNASAIYANRSDIHFRYATKEVFELADLLRKQPDNGRTFFFGFLLHELGASDTSHQDGGHLAPLAAWSGKQLFSSHFFHARWSAIDPIPEQYRRRGREGIEEFLDLMNATHVVALRKEWLQFCEQDPRYQLSGQAGAFKLYRRSHYSENPVLEGSISHLRVEHSRIIVRPNSAHLVLKYRYLPSLRAYEYICPTCGTPDATLAPAPDGLAIKGRALYQESIGRGQTEPFELIELTVPESFVATGRELAIGYSTWSNR